MNLGILIQEPHLLGTIIGNMLLLLKKKYPCNASVDHLRKYKAAHIFLK